MIASIVTIVHIAPEVVVDPAAERLLRLRGDLGLCRTWTYLSLYIYIYIHMCMYVCMHIYIYI